MFTGLQWPYCIKRLFGGKMFRVRNKTIIKTVIKNLDPPNQSHAGQVNFRLLSKALQRRKPEVPVKE